MGYYTDFTLEFENIDRSPYKFDDPDLRAALLNELSALDVFADIDLEWSCDAWDEWSDYREDMCRISCKFPGILFCLHGAGDRDTDQWDEYFLNGGYQHCLVELYYPPFDPNRLTYPTLNKEHRQ